MPDALAAFRHDGYRRFTLARTGSTVGHQILLTAVSWEVYERTGSAWALGMVGLAQIVPILGLALWAGHLADRLDRRRIASGTQGLLCVAALALAWLSGHRELGLGPLYGVLALIGIARAFQTPALQALLPSLVPVEDFGNAVAWRSLLFELASVLGPVIGATLIQFTGGVTVPYGINAATAFAAAVLMGSLPASARHAAATVRGGLLDGVRYVWAQKALLGAMTLDLVAVLFGGATALFPIFAKDILGGGPATLGYLKAAPAAGAILTSLVLIRIRPFARSGRALLVSVALYGAAMAAFGLSRNLTLSLVLLALSGAADAVSVYIRHSVVQLLTPERMRGKVSAVNGVFFTASNELGEVESGMAAELVGTAPSVLLGGLATVAVVGACAWGFPQVRRLGRLDELRAEEG